MDPHRTVRLAEALREELDELIAYELSDPRVGSITVTEVVMSPDKRRAQVRVRIHSGDEQDAIRALEHARNFLRHELTRRLGLFRIPDLHFEPDVPGALGGRMEQILKRVRKGRPRESGMADHPASEKKAVE